MTHWGATIGLLGGFGYCLYRGYHAWKEGWPVFDTMQGCYTGYSIEKGEFDITRPVSTYVTIAGGAATYVAIKTGYNQWTPKGANV